MCACKTKKKPIYPLPPPLIYFCIHHCFIGKESFLFNNEKKQYASTMLWETLREVNSHIVVHSTDDTVIVNTALTLAQQVFTADKTQLGVKLYHYLLEYITIYFFALLIIIISYKLSIFKAFAHFMRLAVRSIPSLFTQCVQ